MLRLKKARQQIDGGIYSAQDYSSETHSTRVNHAHIQERN